MGGLGAHRAGLLPPGHLHHGCEERGAGPSVLSASDRLPGGAGWLALSSDLPPKGICRGPGPPPPHSPQNTSELVPVKERGLALVPLLCIAS